MNFFVTFLIISGSFALMAVGYIVAKKVFQKGCALSPDECACRREGKNPAECDKTT